MRFFFHIFLFFGLYGSTLTYCPPPTALYPPPTAHLLLPSTHLLLPSTHHRLPTSYCPPPTTDYPPPNALHPPPTTNILLPSTHPVLSSRSALSDLGLIADHFEKMLLNWSYFCLKSPLFGLNCLKSLIFTLSAFHTKQKILENFLKYGIFLNKSNFLDVKKTVFGASLIMTSKWQVWVRFWSDFW